MDIFQTSQDYLNLMKGTSVFILAVFGCVALYYMARIFEQIFRIIKEMRDRINKVDEVIQNFKDKMEHGASYFLLIGEGLKKLIEVVQEKTEKKKRTTKK